MGGSSCVRRLDGDKLVCLDPIFGISPDRRTLHSPSSCLVLSVGVGHDLSFDLAMTRLGCRVHAIDDDDTYRSWSQDQGKGLSFHQGRLGTRSGTFTFCDQGKGIASCATFTHHTLKSLRKLLGYGESRRLHYLKVDIEGAEWDVLAQALTKGWLSDVHQLAVELHLEDLRDPTLTEAERRDVAAAYLGVVARLEESGLALAAFTPNVRNPEACALDGVSLPCYAEVLWLRQ
ncbi:uncharacterized protein LOC122250297 [Penaeus japonicus]|uniref:uncharacterized protein LOC122250297 n=1 Tax=Penaeus japonicus TaxID=27405 RepID=UPI001C716298|nr:uncharacterized protein LOC122250297 [Penaeus japonicus]